MADKTIGLHPKVKELLIKLVAACKAQGIDIIVTQGLRSIAVQNALYACGRTKPGKKVTNAKGGYSYHNYGLAFDVCVMKKDAKGKLVCDWESPLFAKVGAIGKKLGLEWGGDFTSLKDTPHFQLSFGLKIKDLLAGKRPA